MKKCLFALVVSLAPLMAMNIGSKGEPYLQDGVLWQRMTYQDEGGSFEAAFPGSPRVSMYCERGFMQSQVGETTYTIMFPLNLACPIPDKFEERLLEEVEPGEVVQFLPLEKGPIKLIAEFQKLGEATRRVYLLEQFFCVIEVRGDTSLADPFFKALHFTPKERS